MDPDPYSFVPLEGAIQAGFGSTGDIISIIVLLILLALSATVSGSEAAFFSLSPGNKEDLHKEDSKNSKTVLQLLQKPRDLLATILITNNFVNVGIVILSSSILHSAMSGLELSSGMYFFIEVVVITLVLLLIGEVIPKIYATKNAVAFALGAATFLTIMNKVPPISWIRFLLVSGSKFIHRMSRSRNVKLTTDELEQAIALTRKDDVNEEEHKILEGIVRFGNTQVRQIMRQRLDVYAVEVKTEFKDLIQLILDCGHSRLPVYDDTFDKIVGILFIKDLLPHLGKEDFIEWPSIIRQPFFVTEKRKIDDLLKDFQEKKVHMAVVVDEYGGTSGIVTLEDVLEEIVGDITDEFDEEDIVYTKIDDFTYLFEGKTGIVDVVKVLDIDEKELNLDSNSPETIGGLIIELAGRIPKNNEFVELNGFKLIVESSDKKRVKMIKMIIKKNEENESD
jgi:putative hemolysin